MQEEDFVTINKGLAEEDEIDPPGTESVQVLELENLEEMLADVDVSELG